MAQAQIADFATYRARRAGVQVPEALVRKEDVAAHFKVSEKTVERWQNPGLFDPPLPTRRSGRRMVRYELSACRAWHQKTFPG